MSLSETIAFTILLGMTVGFLLWIVYLIKKR